ncbi:Uncharacterized membrane protein YsdA, DUF1294 family [Polaromonas sp. OV174]|uniref:DUF1294 domain-containing protein n=1 Tax=Polaromonas sp. OV174 TaxID=1855300 RepID=UPI0008E71579|nr:cold shock and DUF1294 domain-containing protein [Polaromonas sp. OV174]SFC80674.1 Uncharacterized membrane protein YsdA, DUF1294 family [Polaromonas sp. OV174]
MKKEGKVVRWDKARGFGFISSPDTPVDVFFHTRDFHGMAVPHQGMLVTFEEIHVGGKGPRAMSVKTVEASRPAGTATSTPYAARQPVPAASALRRRPTRAPNRTPTRQTPVALVMLLILGWTALVLWGVSAGRLPTLILAGLALLNLLTFCLYWIDKQAAQAGRWRTKEETLHLMGLLGGWPGAWLAHQVLRHKSRKAEFQATYWGTVLLNGAALLGWLFWLQPQSL